MDLFDFEAVPDVTPDLGGQPDPGPDPAAEPQWALSQDDFRQLQSTVETLAQLEAARAQPYLQTQQNGNEGPVRPDPWNRPESFDDDLDKYIEAKVQPFQQRFETLDQQESNERVLDVLADLETSKGEFLEPVRDEMRQLATQKAREFYPQMAAKMGHGDAAGEAALQKAYEYAKAFESKLADAAVKRHTNEISTLAGAPRQPGSTYSQGLQVRTVPDYRAEGGSVVDRLLSQG